MTNQQHPITPPSELVRQWLSEHYGSVCVSPGETTSHVATQAARWGADTELEACAEWLDQSTVGMADLLRESRRPEPSSLKEEALHDLEALEKDLKRNGMGFGAATIRRALEALPND